jgi:hypothetical protein
MRIVEENKKFQYLPYQIDLGVPSSGTPLRDKIVGETQRGLISRDMSPLQERKTKEPKLGLQLLSPEYSDGQQTGKSDPC